MILQNSRMDSWACLKAHLSFRRTILRSVKCLAAKVAIEVMRVRQKRSEYDAEYIFSMDRKGNFYKFMSRRTFICQHKKLKTVRVPKSKQT